MEASVEQRLILFEEMACKGAPELSGQAINQIGPIIIRFGTPRQKVMHLPSMLHGDTLWCQGYSEPNSGSDLASLRTSARVEGDKLIVNGQRFGPRVRLTRNGCSPSCAPIPMPPTGATASA